jgi:hypothetical protein
MFRSCHKTRYPHMDPDSRSRSRQIFPSGTRPDGRRPQITWPRYNREVHQRAFPCDPDGTRLAHAKEKT